MSDDIEAAIEAGRVAYNESGLRAALVAFLRHPAMAAPDGMLLSEAINRMYTHYLAADMRAAGHYWSAQIDAIIAAIGPKQ